jgi:hypothetical protein
MAFEAALKGAAASLKAGRHAEVIAPLEAALVSEPTGARAVLARYYLGVAYAKASQLDKAIAHLQAAVDGDTDQEDARFQLASALDRSGAFAQARAEYDRYATAHPQSPWAVFAMRRSATLALMPPVAPAAAPVPGTAPAPGAAPAPAPGAPAFRPAPPSFTPPPAGAAAPWRPAPAPAVAPPPRAPVPAPKAPASAAGAAPPGAGTPPSPPASALSQPSEAPSPPSQQQPPPAPTP